MKRRKKKKILSTLTLAVLTHFFLFSRTLQMKKKKMKRVGLKQCLLLILSVERYCLQET